MGYFKELLLTLKSIDNHLNELRKTATSTEEHTAKIARCVKANKHRHGDREYLSTGHWND